MLNLSKVAHISLMRAASLASLAASIWVFRRRSMSLKSLRASRRLDLFFSSMASVICLPILTMGFSEDSGSWKIIEILSPRSLCITSSGTRSRSLPSYRISPPSTMALPARMPIIALEVTDLPEPDSPTMASVLPRSRSKEISRTAFSVPLVVRKATFSLFTSSILSIP